MIHSSINKKIMVVISKVMSGRKRSVHYVNNKDFLNALIEYRNIVILEARKEIPEFKVEDIKKWKSPNKPKVPNYIGECFLKIANHLSYKPNFVNYMFKEDMICDGIENCLQYIHNFDPEKSQNPFAYFTQVIHYAFLRRIQKEKKQMEIKNKIIEKTGYTEVFEGDSSEWSNYSDFNTIKDNVHNKLRY